MFDSSAPCRFEPHCTLYNLKQRAANTQYLRPLLGTFTALLLPRLQCSELVAPFDCTTFLQLVQCCAYPPALAF